LAKKLASNKEKSKINTESLLLDPLIDPGKGYLRTVVNLSKVEELDSKPDRRITYREIHEVMFSKGRSSFIEKYLELKLYKETEVSEEQYRIIGVTNSGRPLMIVFTVRDKGLAKRIITAWQPSIKSKDLKKLLKEYPELKDEIQNYRKSQKLFIK
jgi:uncharacterized DUF497 family protein